VRLGGTKTRGWVYRLSVGLSMCGCRLRARQRSLGVFKACVEQAMEFSFLLQSPTDDAATDMSC